MKTIECGVNIEKKSKNPNCEHPKRDTQMEQNVLYRVDSYNSDDALELSDIEETVINEHGKVVEVKTIFKQRPSGRKSTEPQLKITANDPLKNGLRTIGSRRRSNSISGSLDIEIVELAHDSSDTNYENLSKEPFIYFADDERGAIKLADLCDSPDNGRNAVDHAIDVVEIIEDEDDTESYESGSGEEEEIDEEIEEEIIEEEEEEVTEEEVTEVEEDSV